MYFSFLKSILFSPGDGVFNKVNKWFRFCPFQNSGANLTQNETELSIARNFCEKESGSSSLSSPSYLIMPIILLIYFL
jgi:hypothetical protein